MLQEILKEVRKLQKKKRKGYGTSEYEKSELAVEDFLISETYIQWCLS